jgi:hypothetical protein
MPKFEDQETSYAVAAILAGNRFVSVEILL